MNKLAVNLLLILLVLVLASLKTAGIAWASTPFWLADGFLLGWAACRIAYDRGWLKP